MKKRKKSSIVSKIKQLIAGKGFYIALSVLVVIAGVSIYAKRIQNNNQSTSLSFDDEAWHAALEESGVQYKGSFPAEEVEISSAETPSDIESEPVASETSAVEENSLPDAVETAVSVPIETENMLMPCNGRVLEPCSLDNLIYSSTTDDWRTHNGLDIAAVEGNPVLAVASGVVSKVCNDDMLGIVLVLDHGNGISTLYGNLQSTEFISVGTAVAQGDIIGGVGKPGALEADKEPHLHFEVYKNGELCDPAEFLG